MKRLFTCILLCAFCTICWGQLNIKSSYDGSKTKSCHLNVNNCLLNYNPEIGFFITSKTSNQFDKHAIFFVGDDKESALNTINDIIGIFDNEEKDFSVSVEMGGRDHILTLGKQMGTYCLWIKSDGCAGRWWLIRKNLEKGKKWIENNF